MAIEVYADNVRIKNASELDSFSNGNPDFITHVGDVMKRMSLGKLEERLISDGVGYAVNVVEMECDGGVGVINMEHVCNGDLYIAKNNVSEIIIDSAAVRHFFVFFKADSSPIVVSSDTYTEILTNGLSLEADQYYLADVITTSGFVVIRTTHVF